MFCIVLTTATPTNTHTRIPRCYFDGLGERMRELYVDLNFLRGTQTIQLKRPGWSRLRVPNVLLGDQPSEHIHPNVSNSTISPQQS